MPAYNSINKIFHKHIVVHVSLSNLRSASKERSVILKGRTDLLLIFIYYFTYNEWDVYRMMSIL